MGTFSTKNIRIQQQQYVSLLYEYNLIMRYDMCVYLLPKIHIVINYIICITKDY